MCICLCAVVIQNVAEASMNSYECQAAAAAAAAAARRGAFNARRSALFWSTSPLSLSSAATGDDNPEALRWPACPTPDSDHALRQRPLVPDPQLRAVARRGGRSASASRVGASRRQMDVDGLQ